MKYYIEKVLNTDFDTAVSKATEALKKEGFGVLSEINMDKTLKEKLDVDFRRYRILGACSPPNAYKALQIEDKIGTLLPCNVIVQELEPDKIEVAAVNPVASLMSVENPALSKIALEITGKLERAINSL